MKNFQIIVLGIFAFFLIAGAIAFATFRGGSSGEEIRPVTLWGTAPQRDMDDLITHIRIELETPFPVTYREIRPEAFNQTLIEALAAGSGPDMVLLSQDLIVRHQDKILPISYESLPEREFKDRFVEEAELYMTPGGILAMPFSLDPMVLYWNRTLLSNAGIAQPPQTWNELLNLTRELTKRDARNNIIQSTIALGEFSNIANAKEILVTLIMQAGNPIILGSAASPSAVLNENFGATEAPAESALRFYTEFANPIRPVYSWNRSLPESQSAFLAGDVAFYIGFASELFEIQSKNPNLNFDVTMLPQVLDTPTQKTFGKMQGVAILKTSSEVTSAFQVLGILNQPDVLQAWTGITGLPPVRRDLLSEQQVDAFRATFYRSALIADAFLDPAPETTETIFRDMVEGITTGREPRINRAVLTADSRLDQLLR